MYQGGLDFPHQGKNSIEAKKTECEIKKGSEVGSPLSSSETCENVRSDGSDKSDIGRSKTGKVFEMWKKS